MLVLTRHVDEVIRIGPDIEVMVVRIQENEVRLGIKAPVDMAIQRAELVGRFRHDTDSRSLNQA